MLGQPLLVERWLHTLRETMKTCKVVAKSVEYTQHADLVNRLIPVMVDQMTDAELVAMWEQAYEEQQVETKAKERAE